ncbi:hypothetical protein G3T14_08840 [Methylobacterium sp. BTF04]|uniref:hypothetical protein n=1 Tax=Methylobacterium sp. BTF04 TaxID=2708300 RepID=UPI0013D81967|nr:hypothetical protein [Methylobacterium sp. BTF04]NEU12238.1 hypothetical protein [Methylobacterium sp. BTF04]
MRERAKRVMGVALVVVLAASGARAEDGNFFTNMLKYGGPTVPPSQPADLEPPYCPTVAVPEGGASIQTGAGTSLRYQIALGRLARECVRLQDGTISVKVGVEGHVLLGPAGTPGRFEAPVTITLKYGGKVLTTRTRRIPTMVPAGQAQGLFSLIEDNLIVPPAMVGDYDIEVRVGGAAAAPRAPRKTRKAPAAAATSEAPSTNPAPGE